MTYQNFLAGRWVDGDAALAVEDPATGQTVAEAPLAGEATVARALEAARASADRGDLAAMRPQARADLMRAVAREIRALAVGGAPLLSRESGKRLSDARGEFDEAAAYFDYYGGLADKIEGKHIPLGPDYVDYTVYEPVGVSAQIVPWNFPVSLAARSLAPALAAGNAVIVKSPELDPLAMTLLARALQRAGVPEGAVSVLNGLGREAGARLVAAPEVDQIVFTGSVPTGQAVLRAAAETVTPALVELGGKSAAVVFEDADLDTLMHSVRGGIFFNAGQVCSAMSRLLVHRSVYARTVEACAALAKGLKPGHGLDEAEHTPVISAAQLARIEALMPTARHDGAVIAAGGARLDRPGHFMAPTVIADVLPSARVAQQEIFGPVLCVTPFDTEAEAIRIANGTEFGLVAGVFTRDLSRALRTAHRLRAGQVFVNEWFAGGIATPFGGIGKSGFGREKGVEALYNYVRTKNIAIALHG
ncbi:aldehyde dehydrogenase family protein [Rhodobacteraceae bacterium 2CG4]|uniref:Aldehyde dehydrogenase family protein n=1 Tax=Halovulum marinum TaxID=2662447 RepID=A0A6L5YY26_9RHOB|nr:aldehyde dehydrogenase family protein [Halovulum marinum]MSU88584.1 aldehyde dehydrogenase family protein [Halovulum marinum]